VVVVLMVVVVLVVVGAGTTPHAAKLTTTRIPAITGTTTAFFMAFPLTQVPMALHGT
jgi:high-affinity Fe2+/Pb2+ permease